MNKSKLRFIVSLAFAPLVLSSATINNSNFGNDTKVYITFDAGEGSFQQEEGGSTFKIKTYTVSNGRQWKDFANDEKPKIVNAPTDYTFDYYTLDGNEILPTQPFTSNATITAHYSYKKPDKPTTKTSAEELWKNCPWEQLCSIADNGFGDKDGNGLFGYFRYLCNDPENPTKDEFVGLTKTLKYNYDEEKKLKYTARVIGVDHDELANGYGAAALTFEFVEAVPGLSYDGYGHNSNVWSTSQLRSYLNGNEFGNLIESGIKDNAKKVYKTTNSGNRAGSNSVDSVEDTFFPLSLKEMGISNYPYNYIDSITATCNKTDLKDGDTVTKSMFTVQAIKDGTATTVTDFDCNPALPYTLQSTDVPGRTFKISYKDKSVTTDTVPVAKIEKSIAVSLVDPSKTFAVGDEIKATDVTVNKIYSDGTSSTLGVGDYNTDVTLPHTFVESDRGIKNIKFSYTDSSSVTHTYTLGVNVGLTSLTVTPTVSQYTVGNSIENDDFTVVANYGDSKTIELTSAQYTTDVELPYICLNSDIADGKKITFTYGTQSKEVTLPVVAALKEINMWYKEPYQQHIVGATITKDWFDIQGYYSDGQWKSLSGWNWDISGDSYTPTKAGYHSIKFTYGDFSTSSSIHIYDTFDRIEASAKSWYTFQENESITTEHVDSIYAFYKDSYSSDSFSPEKAGDSVTYTPNIKEGYTVTAEDVAAQKKDVTVKFTDVVGNSYETTITFKCGSYVNNLNSNNSLNKNNSNSIKASTNNNLSNSLNSNPTNSSPYTVEEEGSTYAYYENSTAESRKKTLLNESANCVYWARSPETLTYSFAWGFGTDGEVGIYNSEYKENSPIDVREAKAVSPCFCIGKTKQNRVAIENNNQSIVSSSNPRNILWDQQYTTTLSLNTNKYYNLAQHCEMFDISTINPANFMVAIGYDNSKTDPSKAYKQIIPLDKVDDVSTGVGYSIVSDGEANPTYTLNISTPENIWNEYFADKDKSCFAGIYIMANAKIKDSESWDNVYSFAKNNQYYLSTHYAPGVTKDITLNSKTYTTRLVGIKEDTTSTGTYAGMTFEMYNPYDLNITQYGSTNTWIGSDYRTALNNLAEDLKTATANQDFTNIMKKTVVGNGSSEVNENEETIFALSPSEMGISQSDYTAQIYQTKDARDSSTISSEGSAYSFYANHSFYMNNLLRYKVSDSLNSVWLRSPVANNSTKAFYIYNDIDKKYYGQVKSDAVTVNPTHYACPCFAF